MMGLRTGLERCDLDENTCLAASAPDCDDGALCTLDSARRLAPWH